jgi:hypothetical protein
LRTAVAAAQSSFVLFANVVGGGGGADGDLRLVPVAVVLEGV